MSTRRRAVNVQKVKHNGLTIQVKFMDDGNLVFGTDDPVPWRMASMFSGGPTGSRAVFRRGGDEHRV